MATERSASELALELLGRMVEDLPHTPECSDRDPHPEFCYVCEIREILAKLETIAVPRTTPHYHASALQTYEGIAENCPFCSPELKAANRVTDASLESPCAGCGNSPQTCTCEVPHGA